MIFFWKLIKKNNIKWDRESNNKKKILLFSVERENSSLWALSSYKLSQLQLPWISHLHCSSSSSMALFRLLCSPSLFPSSTTTQLPTLFPLHNHSTTPTLLFPSAISLHTPFLSPLNPIKPQRTYLYISNCSSSAETAEAQNYPEESTPEAQNDPEEQSEDESSKRRVLAQNTPWTYTANDLRPLFEKYGTVEDIEVWNFPKFLLFWYGESIFNLWKQCQCLV